MSKWSAFLHQAIYLRLSPTFQLNQVLGTHFLQGPLIHLLSLSLSLSKLSGALSRNVRRNGADEQ